MENFVIADLYLENNFKNKCNKHLFIKFEKKWLFIAIDSN